jgi:hypothetical protein
MSTLSPSPAAAQLAVLAQQFTPWRQSRTTPRGRIPQPLWAQAVRLAQVLPCARVATHLGLTPQALTRRHDALRNRPALPPSPQAPPFVEVSAAWRPPTTEGEVQRPDGTRLRIVYREAAPALVPLRQTCLDAPCCSSSRPRVGSFWPCSPSTFGRGAMASRRSVARRWARSPWGAPSMFSAIAPAPRSNSSPTMAKTFGCVPNAAPRAASPGGPLPLIPA